MNKEILARLVTGLILFGMGGMASATQYFPTPSLVGPIDGPVTYNFDFSGLAAADEFTTGALFIRETGAAFNDASQTVNVNIDGVDFGAHYFADDGQPIGRTLQMAIPLSYTDLFYIANNSVAALSITTSEAVSGASTLPDGTIVDLTPPSGSIDVWLDYQGDAPATNLPEPTGGPFRVSYLSEEQGPIDGSTTYDYELDGLVAPSPFLDGHLFVEEDGAAFNDASQTVNVNIDGVDFGAHYFADDGQPIDRALMLEVGLGFTDLFYITHDNEALVSLTTSEAVSGASTLPDGTIVDLTPPSGTMSVGLVYEAVEAVPEPSTLLLFGIGLIGLAGVRTRKQKK